MDAARNFAETGVNFTYTLTACDIYKINSETKQPIRNDAGKIEITERVQLISTDLLGTVTRAARGNCHFMANCPDHYTKFKVVRYISTKDKALTTLVKFVQHFVTALELRL